LLVRVLLSFQQQEIAAALTAIEWATSEILFEGNADE
jgi:hypothetical protein